MIKILYIIESMHNSAGMERVVANKANFLPKMGYEVTIVTTSLHNRNYFYDLPADVKKVDLGINFDDYSSYGIVKKVCAFYLKYKKYKKCLTDYLMTYKQDIVVSLDSRNYGFLYKIPDGSKKILESHFNKYYSDNFCHFTHKRNLTRLIYKLDDFWKNQYIHKYDRYVALTYEDKDLWKDKLNNIIVIPNSINCDKTSRAALSNKIVVSVGRLDPQKGYDMLIRLWSNIYEKHSDWQLHIYGSGQDESSLREMIDSLGLDSVVKLFPPTKNIASVMQQASIYVLSSRYEGLPMVLLEAMAMGLPPVAFKCKCGPKDVISDGVNGFLCEENDEKSMAEHINMLIENEELRKHMGAEAQNSMNAYSHEAIAKQWDLLFNQLCNER